MLHPSTTIKTTRLVYNLHKGKDVKCGRDYSRRFGEHYMSLVHIAPTHQTMKSVLRKYKRKVHAAVTKEFLQLHTREAFVPLKAEYMTEEQKKDSLEMLMFIKEYRDIKIKAHVCAEGRKQCKNYNNANAMSTTVSKELVLISAVINAYE